VRVRRPIGSVGQSAENRHSGRERVQADCDLVLERAVRENTHRELASVARGDLLLPEYQGSQHIPGVVGEVRVHQLGRDVGDRTAGVGRDRIEELGRRGGEAPYPQLTVLLSRFVMSSLERETSSTLLCSS
jgi:hypothetical protein